MIDYAIVQFGLVAICQIVGRRCTQVTQCPRVSGIVFGLLYAVFAIASRSLV